MPDAPLSLAEIDAALEVCERATPGPWRTINNSSHDSGHRFTVWRERGLGYGMVAHVAPWCPPTNLLDVSQKEADADLIALARTLLPRALRELLERHEDTELMDGAADIRIVDGIGGIDIDEATAQAMPIYADPCDSEEEWRLEWRKQFRIALRSAIDAAREEEPDATR